MKVYVTSSRPSQEERELTVNVTMDEQGNWIAELYTNIHKYHNKCLKQGWTQTSETRHKDGTWIASEFIAPAKAISIGKAIRPKRQMTEEQKQAMSERMIKWRNTKNEIV